MVAELVDYVVGVDTHRDEHTLALVEAATGAVVAQRTITSNGRGYAEALRFAQQRGGTARVWAVEGAGHYGAGLARYLRECGETVLEVGRSSRSERRLRGKDDRLDAIRAARAALSNEPLARPRSGERREALRLLLLARRSAVDVRREALVQLRSVLVTAPDRLRDELRDLPLGKAARALQPLASLERCGAGRACHAARPAQPRASDRGGDPRSRRARRRAPRPCASAGAATARGARRRTDRRRAAAGCLVASRPPPLGGRLCPPRRRRPVPASSGQTSRQRLSRGGDRQLNRALHTVVLHRRQHDPATRDYIARRIAEGKSAREATRLLKRYLARSLYRLLQNQEPLMA